MTKDKPMTFHQFEALAAPAYPLNDDDWGSNRQLDAENAFFETVERELPGIFSVEFTHWLLKATTEEMLDETLNRIARAIR